MPSRMQLRINIITFVAALLRAEPARKVIPPQNMDHFRPKMRVTDAARNDARLLGTLKMRLPEEAMRQRKDEGSHVARVHLAPEELYHHAPAISENRPDNGDGRKRPQEEEEEMRCVAHS
ncbi:hypothetical protein ZWY2020_034678 [Hordeum vulgare]|nr:hypothetical protein ZWY2020_034678 [Hordeum vulgare]